MRAAIEAAANAARSGAAEAVQVVPNGRRLGRLVQLLAQGTLTVSVGERFPLEQGAAVLAHALRGSHGTAIVLRPGGLVLA